MLRRAAFRMCPALASAAWALSAGTLALSAAACVAPRTAAEHREIALREQQEADEHLAHYDPEARAVALSASPTGNGLEAEAYNPTHFEKTAADAHARAAERHRAAARALEQTEDLACASTPRGERGSCPLLSPAVVQDIPGGVRVRFNDAGAAIRAADLARCQQAFAVLRNFEDLPSCALYGRNLQVLQKGDTLELTASGAESIARLRANVRGHRPGSDSSTAGR